MSLRAAAVPPAVLRPPPTRRHSRPPEPVVAPSRRIQSAPVPESRPALDGPAVCPSRSPPPSSHRDLTRTQPHQLTLLGSPAYRARMKARTFQTSSGCMAWPKTLGIVAWGISPLMSLTSVSSLLPNFQGGPVSLMSDGPIPPPPPAP